LSWARARILSTSTFRNTKSWYEQCNIHENVVKKNWILQHLVLYVLKHRWHMEQVNRGSRITNLNKLVYLPYYIWMEQHITYIAMLYPKGLVVAMSYPRLNGRTNMLIPTVMLMQGKKCCLGSKCCLGLIFILWLRWYSTYFSW
jgi:hypothetical protein